VVETGRADDKKSRVRNKVDFEPEKPNNSKKALSKTNQDQNDPINQSKTV